MEIIEYHYNNHREKYMIKLNIKKWILPLLFMLFIGSCDKDNKCNNCDDLFSGYIYMKVTASDLVKYDGLAQLNGVNVGVCIRAYVLEEELNLKTVTIADECCCEY